MEADKAGTGFDSSSVPLGKEPGVTESDEMEPVDSELFIRKAFTEDPEKGCELLFRAYYNDLCSTAIRMVYSKQIAEDVVGEVFLNFWNNRSFETIRISYRAYLFRAVRNRAYNYLRFELGKYAASLEGAPEPADFQKVEQPDQIILMDELVHRINQVVSDLPPMARRVFIMSRYEGKPHLQIAAELGINTKTVESHITRALHSIRKLFPTENP